MLIFNFGIVINLYIIYNIDNYMVLTIPFLKVRDTYMIFSRDLGIDLGTSNTKICDRKGRIIINEPSVVAVDVKSKRVVATGNEAKNMIGRTPGSIVAVRPLNYGVIADFDMTSDMLRNFIHSSSKRSLFTRTRVVISIPNYVTEVER